MKRRTSGGHEKLLALAREAMTRAYAPYSRFSVGAAVEAQDGSVFTGANVENASYGLTMCAERVALFTAVAAGKRRLTRIAVVSSNGGATYPCGACRQALHEFSHELEVIVDDGKGGAEITTLSGLLPKAFGPADLA
ncbi:MAG: cytidine deaminase [Nitrospinae bacterium]|nr:cytidine deaminase [Nitrospinota bacterium]